jgi:ABC-type sugar transport system substrate-binding protein
MRKPTPTRVAVPLALLAVGALALLLVSPHVARAQDRATGVQRVKTIGFTVADVERESNFFANVCSSRRLPISASWARSTTR